MEKWRERQLETLAQRFAVRLINKGVPSGEEKEKFLERAIQNSIESKKGIEQITPFETEALARLMHRAIDNIMSETLELERNDTGRFLIEPHPDKHYEKRNPGKFTIFEREKQTEYGDMYHRAAQLAKKLTKKEISIDEASFSEEVEKAIKTLKERYPFLFDAETGEARTAIQPVYLLPYTLSKKEQSSNARSSFAPQRYRKELFDAEETIIQLLDKELDLKIPKGFSTPLHITNKVAQQALMRRGIALYLPELYHGYSPALAAEHYKRHLEDDFQLCDPLSGMIIAYQNLESLDRDPRLSHRIQAYHCAHRGKGRDDYVFSMVVSYKSLTVSTVRFNRGSSDISTGLIFTPEPEATMQDDTNRHKKRVV
ncbi:hypothetical protein GF369_04090 [Candidatus Peregrinibacteria bacterium]|nr:hypothetical protein [Candidatus Peregrinibacteria bacterium]